MNELRKELVRMSRELVTLKTASGTGTVESSKILVLKERLPTIDGRVRILADENERTQ